MHEQIAEEARKFIDSYKEAIRFEKSYNETSEEKIKVHQVSSRIAFLYEKIRNTVDYKEEHLLRKNAVERIFRRRLATEKNELNVAKFLIYELIRARYLPNDKIPQKRIFEIKEIVEKYTLLINNIPEKVNDGKVNSEYIYDLVIELASCEIEEKIVPCKKENAIIEFARKIIDKKLKNQPDIINEEDRKIQIYIAILRNLTKSDVSLVRYRLFEIQHPEWFFAPSEEMIIKLARNIGRTVDSIEKQINDPLGESFSRFVKKNLAYFTILHEVISKNIKNIDKVFSHHLRIEDEIKETCLEKYREAKIKLRRAAIRSIIYIFITKMLLAFLIELPFDKYILGHINYLALGINVIFPPLLMFLVATTIKVPSKKNTELIVAGIKEMIYDDCTHSLSMLKKTISKDSFFYKLFKIFYAVVFIASFGIVIWILRKASFNIMSIALFSFFLSVVSYFGTRIRRNARELVVTRKREGIVTFLTDLFSIPIIQMGKWLSTKFAHVNIFVFVLDFVIEAPFKTFVEIFEEWIYFIKEEKDKIY